MSLIIAEIGTSHEGSIEKAKEIASKMIESNMDLDTISNLTGLAKEEIKKLK